MLLITCPPGLAQITKKELQFLGFPHTQIQGSSMIFVQERKESDIAYLNLWLRTANRISLVVDTQKVMTFDELFETVLAQSREKIIGVDQPLIVQGSSYRSQLTSVPAVQRVIHKAIITKLMGSTVEQRVEDPRKKPLIVHGSLRENTLTIVLDSSGESLHRRGYRLATGDAPLKETIAAGLVLSSGRKFSDPLLDPCCGSGTIAIEATMIAKNIAPGLQRKFAFENRERYPHRYLQDQKATAQGRQVHKDHSIFASDSDPRMIDLAQANAAQLGLKQAIYWEVKGVQDYAKTHFHDSSLGSPSFQGTIITNPPYGLRMNTEDIHSLHTTLFTLIDQPGVNGGIITGYAKARECRTQAHHWTELKLKNGSEDVDFFKKKPTLIKEKVSRAS